MNYVFVYGTLKKGFHNHYRIKDSRFVADATLPGYTLYAYPAGFPVMVKGDGNVKGEIYEVSDETLANLDRLEGADYDGGMYRRETVPWAVPTEPIGIMVPGETITVQAYVWSRSIEGLAHVGDSWGETLPRRA